MAVAGWLSMWTSSLPFGFLLVIHVDNHRVIRRFLPLLIYRYCNINLFLISTPQLKSLRNIIIYADLPRKLLLLAFPHHGPYLSPAAHPRDSCLNSDISEMITDCQSEKAKPIPWSRNLRTNTDIRFQDAQGHVPPDIISVR